MTRRDLGPRTLTYPMPVLLVGVYDAEGRPNLMAAAWGGICNSTPPCVSVSIRPSRWTHDPLLQRKAFTLAVPGTDTLRESDFLGIASSNKMADKFQRTGLHASKSQRVDAPVIAEYPLTLECEVVEIQFQPYGLRVLGRIVNVLADQSVLDEEGKIDAGKLSTFVFDQMRHGYYAIGEKVGQAWHSGADLMKK